MNILAIIKKSLSVSVILAVALVVLSDKISAQNRERIVKTKKTKKTQKREIRPTTQSPVSPKSKRSRLTNEVIVRTRQSPQSLVRKTSKSQIRIVKNPKKRIQRIQRIQRRQAARNTIAYKTTTRSMMMNSINRKIGIPYRLGTHGPRRYDCSGFVWKVFQESGIRFTRTSARHFWKRFEPVSGDDRFEFGTLVFFNRLGHIGIVADKNGFYHASSSRGVTYSKFEGYWSKRIVGYRRVPKNNL